MENVSLALAAQILKMKEKSLAAFPEEIKNEMLAVLEMADPKTDEEISRLHDTLGELWQRGSAWLDMIEVSESCAIRLEQLLSLDIQSQLMISFEFALDKAEDKPDEEIIRHARENFERSLKHRELPMVAELLDIPYNDLRAKYKSDVWEQLCGAYMMEHDENGNDKENESLINELHRILDEADDKKEENSDEKN